MILVDKPYISDFFIKNLKENNFPVIDTPTAREMLKNDDFNWISEEDAIITHRKNKNNRVYTNSENSIAWIEQKLNSSDLSKNINVFKNKIKFRELIKDLNPEYFFKGVKYDELRKLDLKDLKFPFILKPAIGFFSIGVYKIDDEKSFYESLEKIENEIELFKKVYPKEVLDVNDFIIEDIITGKEYAIDCYFDENGELVILNIMHHIFSSENDVSDRIYSGSKEIMFRYYNEISEFLKTIGAKTDLKNFPAHVEVRINEKGEIHPIEINPLRFGGWHTSGDFIWYAYGINSYDYFLNNKKPNWDKIFESRKDKIYSIVILDNNSGIDVNDIKSFDYNLLLNDFENILELRKIDFKNYPIFGIMFTETSAENKKELEQILTSDLKKYINAK